MFAEEIESLDLENKLNELSQLIEKLKNNKVVYEGKTLNDLLIEAKTGRQYLSLLEVMIHDSRISLEPNLGVIEYGNPNIDMFAEEIESLDLENKLNELSQLIEKLNTEVEIEVDLENT